MGINEPRMSGPEYFDMVDEFMQAVFARWPNVVVQFEDFETPKAVPLLARYRHKYRMFNDDIQGTGSVTLSGMLSALRNAGESIADCRVLCVGAGSAGLGVCEVIVDGMVEAGLPREEAMKRFVVTTSTGALGKQDGKHGDPNVKRKKINSLTSPWINDAVSDGTRIADIIAEFKPNVLLGLSTVKDTFDEEIVRAMAKVNARPIIMPMSNPTDKAECTPEQAYTWTDGRAVVATGSPFQPVELNGQTFIPSQCNNMYIFPGIGLACSIAGVQEVTNKMLYLAAEACTNTMTQEEIDAGRTFPKLDRIREVSKNVAVAVIEEGIRQGICPKLEDNGSGMTTAQIDTLVDRKMYFPRYVPLVH
jgi:malate dehydrogenase (oxaloacetate-decarboxylating)(NADP+)